MIKLFKPFIANHVGADVEDTLDSGYIAEGPKVREFEIALEKQFEINWVVVTNSCTSAIELGLEVIKRRHGIRWKAEALACPLTCFARHFSTTPS